MIQIKGAKSDSMMLNIISSTKKLTRDAIRKGFYKSGVDIIGRKGAANDGLVKKQMNAPKSGRRYKTYQGIGGRLSRPRLYTASATGQSPAVVSGKLRKSLAFTVIGQNQLRISADTPYAEILEKGGNAGRGGKSKIARRNYLKKAILQSRKNIIRNIQNELK